MATIAIGVVACVGAAMLHSEATGSAGADLVWRVIFTAVAVWGGAVAGARLCAVVAVVCVVGLAVASSPLLSLGAVGAGLFVSSWLPRPANMFLSARDAAAAACVALFALDLHGVGGTGRESALAALVMMPLLAGIWLALDRAGRVRVVVVCGATVLVLAGVTFAAGLTAFGTRSQLEGGVEDTRAALRAAKDPSQRDVALERFNAAHAKLVRAEDKLDSWWVRAGEVVPVTGRNLEVARTLVSTGADLTGTAAATAQVVDPDAMRPKNGRMDLAELKTVGDALDEASVAINAAVTRVRDTRSPWLPEVLRTKRDEFATEIDNAAVPAANAADGIRTAYDLLGGNGRREILVLLMTNSESRAVGGWPGSYAQFEANNGAIRLVNVGRTANDLVAPSPMTLDISQEFRDRYSFEDLTSDVRGLLFTPDFPTSGRLIAQAYEQITHTPVDSVIGLDAYGFAALLRITGPMTVAGWPVPLTADNAAQVLLFDQYVKLGDDRDAFQNAATSTVFERLTTNLQSDVRTMRDALGAAFAERRITFFSKNPTQEAFLTRVGVAGAVPEVRGDYAGLVTQNQVGNKIDWFLRRDVDYAVQYDPTSGLVKAKATITLRNLAPSTGLPPLIIGNIEGTRTEPGLNRTWFNWYTPLGLVNATLDGEPLTLYQQDELGRNVFWADLEIPAGQTRTVVLELTGLLRPGSGYLLDVARQPTVGTDRLAVHVNLPSGWNVAQATAPLVVTGSQADGSLDQAKPLVIEVTGRRGG